MYYRSSKTIVAGWILLAVVCPICQAIDGSGTTNYIPRFTASSTIGDSILYQSGTIGINLRGYQYMNDGTGAGMIYFGASGVHPNLYIRSDDDPSTYEPASERVFIGGSGRVGIGTPFPLALLDVRGSVNIKDPSGAAVISFGASGTYPNLYIRSDDDPSTYEPASERVFIGGNGNVGIGTTNPGGWKLYVNGGTHVGGNLDVNGYTFLTLPSSLPGTYYAVYVGTDGKLYRGPQIGSSLRYKAAVRDLDASVKSVLDLRPVHFDWKADGKPDIGLIAEEVANVLPDLVIPDDQGRPNGVKYDKVPIYLLKVIRTQQSQISALEERLAVLEEVIKRLDSKAESPETDTPVQGVGRKAQ